MSAERRIHLSEGDFERNISTYFKRYLAVNSGSKQNWDLDANEIGLSVDSTSVQPLPMVSFRFTVKQGMCNFTNNLHGGCAATIIDALTTVLALAVSQPGFYSAGGVSRNLRATFFRAVPRGADVRLTCSLIHATKSFVLLRGEASKIDTGELCFVGENEKVNTDSRLVAKL